METPDEEWWCEMKMGIKEARMMYNHICYSIEVWPGSPRRPREEQEYLKILQMRFFAMIQEYNYTHLDTDK